MVCTIQSIIVQINDRRPKSDRVSDQDVWRITFRLHVN